MVVGFHPLGDENVHRRQLCSSAGPMESLWSYPCLLFLKNPFLGAVLESWLWLVLLSVLHPGSAGLQCSLINPLSSLSFRGISFAEWEVIGKFVSPGTHSKRDLSFPCCSGGLSSPRVAVRVSHGEQAAKFSHCVQAGPKLCFSPVGRIRAVGGADAAPSVAGNGVIVPCLELIPPLLGAVAELVWGAWAFVGLSDGI